MAEDCDLSHLSSKERMAVMRRKKYRENEEYRQHVRYKAEKSKQRQEYKDYVKSYNKEYYQKRKEQLKQRRESRKNSSFEDSNGDLQIKHESTSFVHHEDEVVQEDQEVEVDVSGSVIIEDVIIDESDMVVEEAEESEIHDMGQEMYFSGDVENREEWVVVRYESTTHMHSYPKATSPPRRRPKAKQGVDKMIQADVDVGEEEEEKEEIIEKSNGIQLVDIGTQVCERDLMTVDAGC